MVHAGHHPGPSRGYRRGGLRRARVRLYRGNYEDNFYSSTLVLAGEAVAKADGSFSFNVPPGQYTLQLATPRDQVAQWVAEPVALRLDPGEIAEARIVVRSGGLWEIGVAEAGSNKPLAQARVNIREPAGFSNVMSITCDADGVARIRLLPGEYEIQSVQCEGYAYDGQRRTVTIEDGDTRRVGLLLTPNVCGVVRDAEGRPVAGAGPDRVAPGAKRPRRTNRADLRLSGIGGTSSRMPSRSTWWPGTSRGISPPRWSSAGRRPGST